MPFKALLTFRVKRMLPGSVVERTVCFFHENHRELSFVIRWSSLSFVVVPKANVWQPRQPRYAFANDKIKVSMCTFLVE
ncbi:hypothetical protein ANTQUA_LOCUS7415 [Anthophora quadrimaculata]